MPMIGFIFESSLKNKDNGTAGTIVCFLILYDGGAEKAMRSAARDGSLVSDFLV